MSNPLIGRIDGTRESWTSELEACRNEILDTIKFPQNPLARLVVELDYLLVEAKLALINLEGDRDSYNRAYSDECATNVYLKSALDVAMNENQRLTKIVEDYESEEQR